MEKYQITKTIRFKLVPVNAPELEEQVSKLGNIKEPEACLLNLVSIGQELSNLLKNYIYTDKHKLKRSVTVHFRWLREFTKDKFFEWKSASPVRNSETNRAKPEISKPAIGSMASQLKTIFPDKTKEDKKESRNSTTKEKRFKLSDVSYLSSTFENFTNDWDAILQNLAREVSRDKESLTRKAEIGKIIKRIGARDYLPLLEKFIDEANDKDDETQKEKLKRTIISFKENLLKAEQWTLPAQSSGIELAKASFNYYTINKKQKEFQKEKKEIEILYNSSPINNENEIFLKDLGIIKVVSDNQEVNPNKPFSKENKPQKKYEFLYEITEQGILKESTQKQEVTLDSLYKFFKSYRANQKKKFKDSMDKNPAYEDIIKKYNLFGPMDQNNNEKNVKAFNKYKELTSKIQKLGEEINKARKDTLQYKNLKDESSKLRQQRGKLFFQGPSRKGYPEERFETYLKFCKIYKDIAMKRGRLNARLKGIEKEEIDSARLQYWSFLVEKDNQHKVVLIPKLNAQKAYRAITSYGEANTDSSIIYYFESLTYRALRKLCFGVNGNTFITEIKEELKKKNKWTYEERDFGEHIFKIKNGQEEFRDEKKLISFYKDVLQTEYVRKNREDGKLVLPANFEEEVLKPEFLSEQEFHTAVEKCCYLRKKVNVGDEFEKSLSEWNAQVLAITSYDLKKIDKSNLKAHTKLWNDFWTDKNETEKFPLRLNPEIKILWREPKATRVDKYGKGTELYDKDKKNRYLYPQYTLVTSFVENAHDKKFDYSFSDHKTIQKAIDEFNAKLRQENAGEWIYGIDRGTKELATLCLVKFPNQNFIKPEFPKLKLYRLMANKYYFQDEEKIKTGQVDKGFSGPIKNISYYLDKLKNNDWFEKISESESACFDLTTAKVIKGNIFLNGDLITFFNLKKLVAQREIFELYHQGNLTKTSEIKARGNNNELLSIYNEKEIITVNRPSDEKQNGIIIYRFTEEQKSKWEKIGAPFASEVIDDLNKYLQSLFEKSGTQYEPSIDKINHLRDSITANIIGVIKFLHQNFPIKSIALENLDKLHDKTGNKFILDHLIQSETNIERRLEWSLYRSLQDLSLVPPSLRETILLKDDFQHLKFGVVKFIEVKGTSSNCPACNNEYKKSGNHYICNVTKCGFSSSSKEKRKGLDPLTNSDKVAAYNIAKRGIEVIK